MTIGFDSNPALVAADILRALGEDVDQKSIDREAEFLDQMVARHMPTVIREVTKHHNEE